jgi:hypothetical protein
MVETTETAKNINRHPLKRDTPGSRDVMLSSTPTATLYEGNVTTVVLQRKSIHAILIVIKTTIL